MSHFVNNWACCHALWLTAGLFVLWRVDGVNGGEASAIRINVPLKAYIWSAEDDYNPYRELSDREKMLSEWVISKSGQFFSIHMVYYDDKLTAMPASTTDPAVRLQDQNQGKEYYWKFLNATGVLPGIKVVNTTVAISTSFFTLADDYISYHMEYYRSFQTDVMLPAYDLIVEFPSNSGSWKTTKTLVDSSTLLLVEFFLSESEKFTGVVIVEHRNRKRFEPRARRLTTTNKVGLLRWRFSTAPLTDWETIIKDTVAVVPYPLNHALPELQDLTYIISPEHIQALENPCNRDLVTFYIIVQSTKTGRRSVFMTIPLLMTENGPDWQDVTDAFCTKNEKLKDDSKKECGFVRELLMTNDHLLALSTKGLYVSDVLSSVPFAKMKEEHKPFLSFGLVNPCADMKDLFYCFDTEDDAKIPFPTPLIHEDSISLHYNPVCHVRQEPNFRDIVIMVVMEDKMGKAPLEPPAKAVTILYAEAPYSTWTLLVKTVSHFDNATNEIRSLKSIFFNHERGHFDAVIEIFIRGIETTRFVRFILPIKTKPGDYYTKLGTAQGEGFLSTYFPESFTIHKTAVSIGSMDIMFMGDQLWIAEAGGPVVYQAVAGLSAPGIIDKCRFNHPDRNFVCVTTDHTTLLVGKIGHAYFAQEVRSLGIPQIDQVAKDELWKIATEETHKADERKWVDKYSGAHLIKGLRGAYFTVSYQGNLVMWYLKGSGGGELQLLENLRNTEMEPAQRIYDFYKSKYQEKDGERKASKISGARYAVKSIDIPSLKNLAGKPTDSPLVPFLIDAMTAVLYEAAFPARGAKREPVHLGQAHVGMTINCLNPASDVIAGSENKPTCDLYIRHLKTLRGGWLPGFVNSALVYVSKSIPMSALKCDTEVHIAPMSNRAFIYIRRGKIDDYKPEPEQHDEICEKWELPGVPGFSQLIGWTFYIPGHFSVLINKFYKSSKGAVDEYAKIDAAPEEWAAAKSEYHVIGGFATVVANERMTVSLGQFEGFFINMNTKTYLDAVHPIRHPADNYARDPWKLTNADCLFDLRLVNNTVLKSSGGSVALNLHDSLSFTVKLFARNSKANIMLQEILLKSTNSNPKLLKVRRSFFNGQTAQRYEFMVTPTGMGKGISTIVVRLTTCSLACATPCSLTFTFHMMRAIGSSLKTIYPLGPDIDADKEILAEGDTWSENHTLLFTRLPVNYRPATTLLGPDIPTTDNIYNADPSKPKYNDWYKDSKSTGKFKHCLDKKNREECGCKNPDKLESHPDYTDCIEKVFVYSRNTEFVISLKYPIIMAPEYQYPKYYLHKPHFSVRVEEVNGRTGYSLMSGNGTDNEYLSNINGNRNLNRGHRFYNASDLKFILYGTGLFHFKATLGEFDSFDEMSGYILVYSHTRGLSDVIFVVIIVASLSGCFLLLFCGFLRVRKRLMMHLPRHDVLILKEKMQ